jgi:hypothetical protein
MFSYSTGLLQTVAAKRAENQFNGSALPLSGARIFMRLANDRHNFFALDSQATLSHNRITSKTSSAAGSAKQILQASPDVGVAILLTPLFLHSI